MGAAARNWEGRLRARTSHKPESASAHNFGFVNYADIEKPPSVMEEDTALAATDGIDLQSCSALATF